jgi:hypothetical protein
VRSQFLKMEFFETYYFSNMLHNVITDPHDYLRNLNDFYGDGKIVAFSRPFPKYSALHSFIDFSLGCVIAEGIDDVELDHALTSPSGEVWVNRALRRHGLDHVKFRDWLAAQQITPEEASEDDLGEYHRDLYEDGPLEKLRDQMTEEIFFLLFANRSFLAAFNRMLAGEMHDTLMDNVEEPYRAHFKKDGRLRRVSIPAWVTRAAFFRDRGCCGICKRDVTGAVRIGSRKHYDHIVPLSRGGLNDVTNVQVLCEECNLKKGNRDSRTSKEYERWY